MKGGDSARVTPEGDMEPQEERKALLNKYEPISTFITLPSVSLKDYRLT